MEDEIDSYIKEFDKWNDRKKSLNRLIKLAGRISETEFNAIKAKIVNLLTKSNPPDEIRGI